MRKAGRLAVCIPTTPFNLMNLDCCSFKYERLLLRPLLIVAAACAAVLTGSAAQAKTHLKISTTAAAMDAFNNWTASTSWAEIKSFKNGNASRPVVDLVLQLQALKAGGLDFDFELVRALTYELAKQAVIEGNADLTAETIWDDEIAANTGAFLSSEPIIRKGEFVKGIYVLPSNEKLLKLTSLTDLSGSVVGVVSSWALDVKTVESLPVKSVHKAATPELVYSAIQRGQADFILEEFSAQPDMSVTRGGVKLIPVPGYKVGIIGSRSFVVGKKSADADAIQKALVAGTKALRENGTIARAYTESGFFNPKVADWKSLQ